MKFTATILMLAIYVLPTYAYSDEKVFPAVWAWEISGKDRTIYLLGEVHGFTGVKGDKVNYDLANTIYDLSDTVWVEASVVKSNDKPVEKKLSARLKPETWMRVKKSLENSVNDVFNKKTSIEKNDFYQALVEEHDKQSAGQSYIGLLQLASVRQLLLNRKENIFSGFGSYKRKQEINSKVKKIREIENGTISDDQWRKLCDTDENAETIISGALNYFESDSSTAFEKTNDLKNIFSDPNSTVDDLEKTAIGPEWNLVKKCNLIPRNREWLPIMLNALKSSGLPVAFNVGISHVVGEEGLLELLRKEGYKNIKRIYTIK